MRTSKSVVFTVDMPPMGKARPRMGKYGVHMPKDYMLWKQKFGALARQKSNLCINGKFIIHISISTTSGKMRSDIDNAAGSVLDALQDVGIIENDRDCIGLYVDLLKDDKPSISVFIRYGICHA